MSSAKPMDSGSISEVIYHHLPSAKFYLLGNSITPFTDENGKEFAGLVWLDEEIERPTDAQIEEWIAAYKPQPTIQDWLDLQLAFEPILPVAMTTSNTNAFSLLLSVITQFHNPDILKKALLEVQKGLPVPLEPDVLAAINQALAASKFGFALPASV